MWCLESVKSKEKVHLLIGKEYTVGRKDTDIVITDDQSVSRKHALLVITHPESHLAHPHKLPHFVIKDQSTFGTVVGDSGTLKKAEGTIKDGVVIKFGTVNSSYKALYEKFIVASSCLDDQGKKKVKSLLCRLGGHIVSDWRKECSLLVMSNLSVTVKAICALVSQKSIVKPEYLEHLLHARESNAKDPQVEDYLPPLAESKFDPDEVSFVADEGRRTLFQGKTFIFLNPKQFKNLQLAISLAGGKPVLMEESSDDNGDDLLVRVDTCVMACDAADPTLKLTLNAQGWVQRVMDTLASHGKRPIPDAEIGYAVLYCSIDNYCNPDTDAANTLISAQQSLSQACTSKGKASVRMPSPACVSIKQEAQTPLTSQGKEHNNNHSQSFQAEPVKKTSQILSPSKKKPLDVDLAVSFDSIPNRRRKLKSQVIEESQSDLKKPVSDTDATFNDAPSPRQGFHGKTEDDCLAEEKSPPKKSTHVPDNAGFDSVPSRTQKPSGATDRDEKLNFSTKRAPDIEGTDFDSIPTRKRRKVADISEKEPTKLSLGNVNDANFDDIPSRRRRRNRDDPIASISQAVIKEDPSPDDSDEGLESTKKSTSPAARSKASPSKSATLNAKSPQRLVPRDRGSPSPTSVTKEPIRGFINTTEALLGRTEKCTEFVESGIKSNIQVEYTSLVKKRTKPVPKAAPCVGTDMIWMGRKVKNFKKFRKNTNAGVSELPRIIGGRDLEVHSRDTKDLDSWFKDDATTSSQNTERERIANDMFDYDPTARKNKKATLKKWARN